MVVPNERKVSQRGEGDNGNGRGTNDGDPTLGHMGGSGGYEKDCWFVRWIFGFPIGRTCVIVVTVTCVETPDSCPCELVDYGGDPGLLTW